MSSTEIKRKGQLPILSSTPSIENPIQPRDVSSSSFLLVVEDFSNNFCQLWSLLALCMVVSTILVTASSFGQPITVYTQLEYPSKNDINTLGREFPCALVVPKAPPNFTSISDRRMLHASTSLRSCHHEFFHDTFVCKF